MKKGLGIVAACAITCALAAPARAYVYWTVEGVGVAANGTAVGRADQDGSAQNHALVNSAFGPGGIVLDSAHIYWANSQTNSIGRANLDGSGANPSFIPNATNAQNATPT